MKGSEDRAALRRAAVAGLAAAALLAAGCGKSRQAPAASTKAPSPAVSPAGTPSFGGDEWLAHKAAAERDVSVTANGSFAHVTYKPQVKFIEAAAVDASIQGISSDGHGVLFDGASPEIRALKAGDVMLVKGGYAAKIVGSRTDGPRTLLLIDAANLVDVVQAGEIKLEPSIAFHGPHRARSADPAPGPGRWLDAIVPAAEAQAAATRAPSLPVGDVGKSAKGSAQNAILDGWKVDRWAVSAADDEAEISARLSKNTNGFKSAISMEGTITDFQFVTDIQLPSTPDALRRSGLSHLSGHLHFVWEIGKDTPGVWAAEDKLKLPGALSIPLAPVLDGMPLNLEISAAFLIHPALTGGNEYSKGGFDIDWVGSKSQEAAANQDQVDPESSTGLTFTITDDANVSPVAPNGMVISFCAPRVELKFAFFGNLGRWQLKLVAQEVDLAMQAVATTILPAAMYQALISTPMGSMPLTNVLGSSADVYAQVIHTEGVTHSSNLSAAPCTKIELKVTGQVGGEAQLFNLTKGMSKTIDTFSKTYTEWRPPSSFCKSV